MQIKITGKVLGPIGILLAEDLLIDQQKHHVTNVLAFEDSPLPQQRAAHRAKLIQGKIPKPLQQLRATHVAGLAPIGIGDTLEREIECVL